MLGGEKADDDSPESIDRISSLPTELIDFILSFLSDDLDVVVRTSVLSRSWKSHWTRVRKLVFKMGILKNKVKHTGLDVVSCIGSILSRHDGPVHHFSLSTDLKAILDQISALDVFRWLQILVQKRICEIFISGSLWNMDSHLHLPIVRSSTLTHLTLHDCNVGSYNDFGGFPSLLHLDLNRVSIYKSCLLSIIFGSPLLRNLDLIQMFIQYEDGIPVVINSPRLQSLCLISVQTFYLIEYPDLTFARISYRHKRVLHFEEMSHQRTCKLDRVVRTMPRVQTLMLDTVALRHFSEGGVPMRLTNVLQSLDYLVFIELNIFSELNSVFCLIRSSPELRSLFFSVKLIDYSDDDWDVPNRYCEEQENGGVLSSLSEVTFDLLFGTDYEMLLIETILHCCPMLKTINIVSDENISPESEEWLFNELLEAQYSNSATIVLNPQCVNEGRRLLIRHLL